MKHYIAFAFDDEPQGGAMDIMGTSPHLLEAARMAISAAKNLGNKQLWHVLDSETSTVYHGNAEEPDDWFDDGSGMTYKFLAFHEA